MNKRSIKQLFGIPVREKNKKLIERGTFENKIQILSLKSP
jgi:hypothetical protein